MTKRLTNFMKEFGMRKINKRKKKSKEKRKKKESKRKRLKSKNREKLQLYQQPNKKRKSLLLSRKIE